MKPLYKASQSQALSLLELLVVVALIGVAAGMIFSATRILTAKSKEATCIANLKSLTSAIMILANDNGGIIRTKSGGTGNNWALWSAQLYDGGYVSSKETFVCPSWPRAVDFKNVNWKWYTYGLNLFDPRATVVPIGEDPVYQYFLRISAIENPAATPLLMDSCGEAAGLEKGTQIFRVWSQKASSSDRSAVHLRHGGGGYMSFFDGHVGKVVPADIKKLGFTAYYNEDGALIKGF